jgi:hypothetical protein
MKLKLSIFFIFLFYPMLGWASIYYVCDTGSTCGSGWSTGSDSNSGTSKSAPMKTISSGIQKLSSGDTLIVGDGTYAGAANTINYQASNVQPPSGASSSSPTIIKAENDGGPNITYASAAGIQILGNENIDASGFAPDRGPSSQHYIIVQGFVVSGSQATISGSKYIKFINIGSVDSWAGNNINIGAGFSEYCLFEGCYAWGGGRYKFSSFHSHHTIFRNCVGRLDYVEMTSNENDPIATYSMYSSTNIEVQNCIDVDSDTEKWGGTGSLQIERPYGAFFNPSTSPTIYSGPINWTNCITLNNKLGFGASDDNTYPVNAHYTNVIGWAIAPTNHANYSSTPVDIIHTQGSAYIQQCTIGNVTSPGTNNLFWNAWSGNNGGTPTTSGINNIWINITNIPINQMFYGVKTLTNNLIYGSGSPPYTTSGAEPSGTLTTNPISSSHLKYLTRLEDGSSLKTVGQSGARMGAEILYQYGKSGTLWGEAGYASLQDGTNGQATVKLWPFPNEALIKTKMAGYKNHSINGARGFCTTGKQKNGTDTVTLTSYIWEYLGNQIPSDIYGGSASPPPTVQLPGAPGSLFINQ